MGTDESEPGVSWTELRAAWFERGTDVLDGAGACPEPKGATPARPGACREAGVESTKDENERTEPKSQESGRTYGRAGEKLRPSGGTASSSVVTGGRNAALARSPGLDSASNPDSR